MSSAWQTVDVRQLAVRLLTLWAARWCRWSQLVRGLVVNDVDGERPIQRPTPVAASSRRARAASWRPWAPLQPRWRWLTDSAGRRGGRRVVYGRRRRRRWVSNTREVDSARDSMKQRRRGRRQQTRHAYYSLHTHVKFNQSVDQSVRPGALIFSWQTATIYNVYKINIRRLNLRIVYEKKTVKYNNLGDTICSVLVKFYDIHFACPLARY